MVYCGKPSRGCQMCRTRRIKCDETKPTCLQCQKSRRQCPGYKDDFDLVFRNETKATERRARRSQRGKRHNPHIVFQAGETSSTKIESDGFSSQALVHSARTPTGREIIARDFMPVSVEEQAPCYFVTNYVIHPGQRTRGHFDFLLPMMKNESPDSHLSAAFSAVALASLANRPGSRTHQLRNQALYGYSKALKATNLALQDPVHQRTDETLAAVLMLGFYETIMNDRMNASAWGSHIDGASEIVRMRGKKGLRTKVGMSLYVTVRGQMVINCITSSKPPVFGKEWWYAEGEATDFGAFITNLSLRVAELRADINDSLASFPRTPEYFQKVMALIRQAQILEQEYQQAVENLPDHWVYHTVAWVDQVPGGDITKAEVYPGRVDMFSDIWVAWAWNNVRITRLYIAGAIVRCAAWLCFPMDFRTTPEYATASKLCIDLVCDIIASVPYHLGWRVGQGGALKSGGHEGFSFSDGSFSNPKALGGFFCMYPLLGIMCTDYITDSQRAWAKGRLLFINDVIGLNHAKVLSTFQLRLPSMIIRRDILVHSPSAAAAMMLAAAAAQRAQIAQADPAMPSIQSLPAAAPSFPPPSSFGASPMGAGIPQPAYNLSPHQQKDAMQRDQREKERKILLTKASNSQGESVEKLISVYLAV